MHDRIRARNTDLILNYTGGMGGDLWFDFGDGASLAPLRLEPLERYRSSRSVPRAGGSEVIGIWITRQGSAWAPRWRR